jgi:ankyrin repeat protein
MEPSKQRPPSEHENQLRQRIVVAAKTGKLAELIALLDQGADVNSRDAHGNTLLMQAVHRGHAEVVGALLARGAGIHLRNAENKTAMWYAVYQRRRDIIDLLKGENAPAKPPPPSPPDTPTERARAAAVAAYSERTGVNFGPADPADMEELGGLGLPESVISFYRHHEPQSFLMGLKVWPVGGVIYESTKCHPGVELLPHSVVVLASTITGDVYGYNLKELDASGEPSIYWFDHEMAGTEELMKTAKRVADNIADFLSRAARNELDGDLLP